MANFDLSGVEFVKKAEVISPLTGASILIPTFIFYKDYWLIMDEQKLTS